MLTVCLMLAGIALMFGTKGKEFAGKVVKVVVAVVLLAAVAPCFLQSWECLIPRTAGLPSVSGGLLLVLGAVVLAVIGFLAWRRRAERAKARELWQRRNGTARARALTAPPVSRDGGES